MMSNQKSNLIDVVSRYNRWIALFGFVLLGVIYLLLQEYPADATLSSVLEAGAMDILPDILAAILIYIFVTFLYSGLLNEMQRLDRENDADIRDRIDALHDRIDDRTNALDRRFSSLERSLVETIPHLETEEAQDAPLSEPVSHLLNQLIHPSTRALGPALELIAAGERVEPVQRAAQRRQPVVLGGRPGVPDGPLEAAEPFFQPGDLFAGTYRIDDPHVNEGNSGRLMRAHDETSGQVVMIKVPVFTANPDIRHMQSQDIERETRILKQLHSNGTLPGVIPLLAAGKDKRCHFWIVRMYRLWPILSVRIMPMSRIFWCRKCWKFAWRLLMCCNRFMPGA